MAPQPDDAPRPEQRPDSRRIGEVDLVTLVVDPAMANNCYLLRCRATGEQVLIDAADQPQDLLALIGPTALSSVVTTHQHWDHHRALAEVVAATGASTLAGAPDAAAITEQTGVRIDRPLIHGDIVRFGAVELRVLAIAGHTPGSIALRYDAPDGASHLFTGDSLFPGGVGATFGDSAAFAQLIDEVETKIFGTLGDDTVFYPGHGATGRLGVEREHLPAWRARGW